MISIEKYLAITGVMLIAVFGACRKHKMQIAEPMLSYHLVNQTVKASDVVPLLLDANRDGKADYTFFAVYVNNDQGVHLNIGTNPIGNNKAKMADPDDSKFQNMGILFSQNDGFSIDDQVASRQRWSDDFAYLTIRTENLQGHKSYIGDWSDGQPHLMALQLSIDGKPHYGWARLRFHSDTEVLTLIDFAYHLNPFVAVKAGKH